MERFDDIGVVLTTDRHGEADSLLTVMTRQHGRRRGFVRGGAGRRLSPVIQPGNGIRVLWQARTPDHLGRMTVEPVSLRLGHTIDDPFRLAALAAVTALYAAAVPERIAYPPLYAALEAYVSVAGSAEATPLDLAADLVRLEAGLLTALGYGLDLTRCAVTGSTERLSHVSPKTGRAVSPQAAGPYRDKLLRLPGFLLGSQNKARDIDDILDGLALTGFFIERHILSLHRRALPSARARLQELITLHDA